jgi:hypothetical protein
MEYVLCSCWLTSVFLVIPPFHNADLSLVSSHDSTTADTKATGLKCSPKDMPTRNNAGSLMLLRFLTETKEEAYFTGLQKNQPDTHNSQHRKAQ